FLAILMLVPALMVVTTTSGCKKDAPSGDDKANKGEGPAKGKGEGGGSDTGGKKVALEAPYDGTITGPVIFEGDLPTPETPKAMLDHKDKDICLMGTEEEKIKQTWIINKDNKGVANAVVFLVPTGNKYFKSDNADGVKEKVEIDQPHCAFV